ncbi:hypothetical protein ABE783_001522 [Salmonella enterica]
MTTLELLAPSLEIYSIDEAFLQIASIDASEPYLEYGRRVRSIVTQRTGLTCDIGIAQTRTLTKLANHAAKTWPATGGFVDLSDRLRQRKLMVLLPVDEVWGSQEIFNYAQSLAGEVALTERRTALGTVYYAKNNGVTINLRNYSNSQEDTKARWTIDIVGNKQLDDLKGSGKVKKRTEIKFR